MPWPPPSTAQPQRNRGLAQHETDKTGRQTDHRSIPFMPRASQPGVPASIMIFKAGDHRPRRDRRPTRGQPFVPPGAKRRESPGPPRFSPRQEAAVAQPAPDFCRAGSRLLSPRNMPSRRALAGADEQEAHLGAGGVVPWSASATPLLVTSFCAWAPSGHPFFCRSLPSRSPVCSFTGRASANACQGGEGNAGDFRDHSARFGGRDRPSPGLREGGRGRWRRCGSPQKSLLM